MAASSDLNDKIYKIMKIGDHEGRWTLPPNCTETVESEFIQYEEGEYLIAEFPTGAQYHNPGGIVLGGYYAVFFDMTIGPLSYLVSGKYAVSLDLNVTFLNQLSSGSGKVTVKAFLKSRSRRLMYFTAEAVDDSGTEIAICNSRMMIVQ